VVAGAMLDRDWIVAHHADTEVRPQLIRNTM
jgi:hypothetical protein